METKAANPGVKTMRKEWGWVLTAVVYLVSIAFQYGIFSQRISSLETSIQELKTDIHEIRDHVWHEDHK